MRFTATDRGKGVIQLDTIDSMWSSAMRDAIERGKPGGIICVRRRQLGITQQELGKVVGCHGSLISRVENGRRVNDMSLLSRLADALGLQRQVFGLASRPVSQQTPSIPRQRAGTGAVAAYAQLPGDTRAFAGRATELTRLDELRAETRSTPPRLVIAVISGTPGVGKSALAVHWAHRVADQFDGRLFVDLRGFDARNGPLDPAEGIRRFLNSFGVDTVRYGATGLDAQEALYRSMLAGKRMLVVLDNARDSDQVRPLLPAGPGCMVVVTSRYSLAGLVAQEGARPISLDPLGPEDSTELLRRRIGDDRVAAEPEAVRDLVGACVGLPLALVIVSARAEARPTFPLQTQAAELEDVRSRLDVLARHGRELDLRSKFSWSVDSLPADARRLFRLLGVHPGPTVSAPAAVSLLGSPPDVAHTALAELTDAHLVMEHEPGRYGFHDLLRAFAGELAAGSEDGSERAEATRRMVDHYVHSAFLADRYLRPGRDAIGIEPARHGVRPEVVRDADRAIEWFGVEYSVLHRVLDHAVHAGLHTRAWQLAWSLDSFLDRRRLTRDRYEVSKKAFDSAQRTDDPRAQARACRVLGHALIQVDRPDDALHHAQRALGLSEALGDELNTAHAHSTLAHVFDRRAEYSTAIVHAQRAHELYRTTDDLAGQAKALNDIGWLRVRLGDPEHALHPCEMALALHQTLEDAECEADTWDTLGYANHRSGRYREAVVCYERALGIYRLLGARYVEAETMISLADTHVAAGDEPVGRTVRDQARAILDELGHPKAAELRNRLDPPEAPAK